MHNVQHEASEKTQNAKIKMVKREACSAKRRKTERRKWKYGNRRRERVDVDGKSKNGYGVVYRLAIGAGHALPRRRVKCKQ